MSIVVVTTFPNASWSVYAEKMLRSFVQHWPEDVPLMVQLDDDALYQQVNAILRPNDGIAVGRDAEHKAFTERHKDDATNYRKQIVRFCHKVFAIKRAYDAGQKSKNEGGEYPRYMIWLDADVITTRKVTIGDIQKCLPKEGDAVSYLGRKDWPHSECGWLAFDLNNRGDDFIETFAAQYTSDNIINMDEWHDSWVFDVVRKSKDAPPCTNLTEGKPGMNIWPHSPMAEWSTHHKGPVAKQELGGKNFVGTMGSNIMIQTKNALSNEELHRHISENQKLIKHWIHECRPNNEEIIVVSAGPLFAAEDLYKEAGKKIVAVKHAMKPLKAAGITPWACILLDPRPHMMDFVEEPEKDVIWFVASQVNPEVTRKLLAAGCKVWGYHASVGAEEGHLTSLQPSAIIHGGSATSTRGLFMLHHMGFRKFKLYGYDLCYPDKVDLNVKDDMGQPKYLEMSLGSDHPIYRIKRCFWTEPQFIAQLEEMNDIIKNNKLDIEAFGEGIVPFIVKIKKVTELRQGRLKVKMPPISSYKRLMKWNNPKKTRFLTKLLKAL